MKFEFVPKEKKQAEVKVGDVIALDVGDIFSYPFLVVEVSGGGYSCIDLDEQTVDGNSYSSIDEMILSEFPNFEDDCTVFAIEKMVLKEK